MPTGGTYGAPSAVEVLQLSDLSDVTAKTGTGTTVVMQGSPSITSPTIATIVNTGTLTLPTSTDTLVGRATTDTLTNKTATTLGIARSVTAAEVMAFAGDGTVASAAGAVWNAANVYAATATITGSTNITTATGFNLINIAQPTLSAASALTVTNSATLYIANAPTGGGAGPATITNAYAIWVDAGNVRTDGVILNALGAVGAPSYTFNGDSDTGMWSPAANTLAWSGGGTELARFTTDPVLLVGLTSATTTTDIAEFRKNQNGASVLSVDNTTAGTAAVSRLLVQQETGLGTAVNIAVSSYSTTFTTSGIEVAGFGVIRTGGGGNLGLNVGTGGSTPLAFWTNNVEVARFTATGIAQFAPPAQSSGTTAIHNITSGINTAGAVPYFSVTGAASTGQTASTEIAFCNFNLAQTVTWATGALATERAFLVQAPTLAFAAASTVTTAVTASVTAACGAGSNATITNSFALQVGGAATLGATAAGSIYGAIDVPAHTITYTGTTQITSVGPAGVRINTLTVTDASAVTIDTAAGLYIAAAPAAAGSVTITNAYALWVDAGAARFDGRVLETQGADIASANNLAVGTDGNVFEITGTTQINLITTTGWANGSIITLVFNASLTVKHNQATSGSNVKILLAGAADFAATVEDTLTLVLCENTTSGQAWRELARTAI